MKVFAYYLPQFYPTPENDKYWGKGFTEWRNVATAKPLFNGHKQPKIPRDFGFYDLRNVETIKSQAEFAQKIGVDGFSFWHYWFGNGKITLEKPAQLLLENKDIEIDFYFTWVNTDWTLSWVGDDEKVIFKQLYDKEDYRCHFEYLLPFFNDKRYTKIEGKPVLAINDPRDFSASIFIDTFNSLARENGFSGIYWLAPYIHTNKSQMHYFDALTGYPPGDINLNFGLFNKVWANFEDSNKPKVIDYGEYVSHYKKHVNKMLNKNGKYIPAFMPNWDNTPRYEKEGMVFTNNKIEYIEELFSDLFKKSVRHDKKIFLIKAWNEWAEGNYIEPDLRNEDKVAQVIKKTVGKYQNMDRVTT